MNCDTTHPTDHPREPRPVWEPPGGILVWLLVGVEVLTFGIGLLVFLKQAQGDAALFAKGRETLNQPIGLLNTLILLTGGWLMTGVIESLRSGQTRTAAKRLLAVIGSGGAFLTLKVVEYAAKLEHGQGLNADAFFTLYWLLTGFHFMHVAVAVVLLLFMWLGLRAGRYTSKNHEDIKSSGVFWHMCDLIWLLLYPLVYLL
jgi:nitric oxide reductase NorE protein